MPPMRIAKGSIVTFCDYLLRVHEPEGEQVNYNIIGLSPYSGYIFERLDLDRKKRLMKCKHWFDVLPAGFYVHMPVGPVNGGEDAADEFRRMFVDLTDAETVIFTKMIVETANKKFLPSFSPTAMVWHLSQISSETGEILPMHGHILFKAVAQPSEAELGFINTEAT